MGMGLRVCAAVASTAIAASLTACDGASSGPQPSTSTTSSATTSAAHCSSGAAPDLSGTRTAYATAAPLNSTRALAGQVGRPSVSATASGVAGWDIVIVPVSAQVQTNGIFAVSPSSFVLVDATGQRCPVASSNPSANAFSIIQVDESHPGSGDVAFLAPHGADLSGYAVLYTEQTGGKVAIARWDRSAPSPSATAAAGCDGQRSTYDVSKLSAKPFGTKQRTGSESHFVDVTPGAPSLRDLPPSDRQPSDVDGVALQVSVSAGGSMGFVDRAQFQLVDSRGMLCRYSSLGSTGETLSTDLVPTGQSKSYTIVFWLPRGSGMANWKLLYLGDTATSTVSAVWTGATVQAPTATASGTSGGSSSASTTPSGSATPKTSPPAKMTTPPPARS